MKLSARIILGFFLTNVIYLFLLAVIFVFVRPVETDSDLLLKYVMSANASANDIRYQTAEQRSRMRLFLASPTHDRKIFEMFAAANQAGAASIEKLGGLLSEAEAAVLRIPAITGPFQKVIASYRDYTELALATPDRQERILKSRGTLMAAYADTGKTLDEALEVEWATFDQELEAGTGPVGLKRRVSRIVEINKIVEHKDESLLDFDRCLIEGRDTYCEQSQAAIAEAGQRLTAMISETRVPAVRTSLEAALRALTQEYVKDLKIIMDLKKINEETSDRQNTLAETVLSEADSLARAVEAVSNDFAKNMGQAVRKVVTAILVGLLVTLGGSLVLALFITRSIVVPIDRLIENLSASAQEVDGASAQLSGAAGALAEGATENAASLEETSAALEELSSMTSRNAENALEANALMARGAEAVIQAEDSMGKVIGAMEEISHSGHEIGKIIKTIDEIAFQTNLLALNAAVEAARAGEAGAGFAVVADEVRNLAIRSAEAARNTSELIAATITNINSGSEMVNATAEAFKAVETSSLKVAGLVSEVAEASREQSQGISQITIAMNEMDKVTQSNAASAEESAGAAGQLSLLAGNLLSAVREMRIMSQGRGAEARGLAAAGKPLRLPPLGQGPSKAPPAGQALPLDEFDF